METEGTEQQQQCVEEPRFSTESTMSTMSMRDFHLASGTNPRRLLSHTPPLVFPNGPAGEDSRPEALVGRRQSVVEKQIWTGAHRLASNRPSVGRCLVVQSRSLDRSTQAGGQKGSEPLGEPNGSEQKLPQTGSQSAVCRCPRLPDLPRYRGVSPTRTPTGGLDALKSGGRLLGYSRPPVRKPVRPEETSTPRGNKSTGTTCTLPLPPNSSELSGRAKPLLKEQEPTTGPHPGTSAGPSMGVSAYMWGYSGPYNPSAKLMLNAKSIKAPLFLEHDP
ncbi:unnamed protein product [Arctogadus glacialis]